MNRLGFQLVKLQLEGANRETAEVVFTAGLNLITGPSDTGKTYILQCIDFLLGAGSLPKDIPEADGYNSARLIIRRNIDEQEVIISRNFDNVQSVSVVIGSEEYLLKAKHAPDSTDTLSYLLLDIVGLAGKTIRKNSKNQTQSLSFRNLAHLCLINETRIITEDSPVFSGIMPARTSEKSVLMLLLDGRDGAGLVSKEDPKISRARIEATLDVLEELLNKINNRLQSLGISESKEDLIAQVVRLDAAHENASNQLSAIDSTSIEKESARKLIWTELRTCQSRIEVIKGLSDRFTLLDVQYLSDIRRLEAIIEAGLRIGQIETNRCPMCGLEINNDESQACDVHHDFFQAAESYNSELKRIRNLRADLQHAQSDLQLELSSLAHVIEVKRNALEEVEGELANSVKPILHQIILNIRTIQEKRAYVKEGIELLGRAESLQMMIDSKTAKPPKDKTGKDESRSSVHGISDLCIEIERCLTSWKFPDMNRVAFNNASTIWDITISGRDRSRHGKGIRALTYSAFCLGLYKYCIDRHRPNPGFIVLDSPLVVYREPDDMSGENSRIVKESFYKDVATVFSKDQVIVIENDEPEDPSIIEYKINIIRFTRNHGTGRYGFIPNAADDAQS